jgi:hypothetical protein
VRYPHRHSFIANMAILIAAAGPVGINLNTVPPGAGVKNTQAKFACPALLGGGSCRLVRDARPQAPVAAPAPDSGFLLTPMETRDTIVKLAARAYCLESGRTKTERATRFDWIGVEV